MSPVRMGRAHDAEQGGSAPRPGELLLVLRACRRYFLTAAAFSCAINLLYLASPLYMLQVYDRVISSGSVVTLLMLTLILLLALAAMAGLDAIRALVLTRASVRLDRLVAARVVAATVEESLRGGPPRHQPLRDFDNFRQFITGPGIHAAFDLPWAPIYIFAIFLLHPALGLFAFFAAVSLVLMALANEYWVRGILSEANETAGANYEMTESTLRNAQAIQAMGMMPGLLRRWVRDRSAVVNRQQIASERSAIMSAGTRSLRLAMQSLILGLGAYLAIEKMSTVGAIFAASILMSRALQPVEQIVGGWRSLVAAQGAFRRLRMLLESNPLRARALQLPKPRGKLSAEGLSYVLPGMGRPILYGVSFHADPGEVVCVIGASGAGKSTLARQIVGVLAPTAGAMRLDNAEIVKQPRASIGRHIGYLPQEVELFADTVRANICRFDDDEDDGAVIEAARVAGVHEMILRLPNGYETYVGQGGTVLSGGYRQRIGLARALYGEPSLVVLDEPSSHLDAEGDAALAECVGRLKERGVTVVMISHRPATIGLVDKILVLKQGTVHLFGNRDDVLSRLNRGAPIHVVARSTAQRAGVQSSRTPEPVPSA